MIGVYDYTVLATYLSLAFGVSGILAAMNGSPYSALLCLMVSGLLDAFDGRIARTKKNRTEQEKRFGIQIDSLNDVVCFGVLPGVIGASLGGGEWWLRASVLFYVLAALIRLAYFNVTEEERQSATNEHRHYYLGVPVTAASFVMPLFWALPLRLGSAPAVIYAVGLTLLAFLFIAPLRIPKPGLKGILCMILLGAAELYLMFYGAMPLGPHARPLLRKSSVWHFAIRSFFYSFIGSPLTCRSARPAAPRAFRARSDRCPRRPCAQADARPCWSSRTRCRTTR